MQSCGSGRTVRHALLGSYRLGAAGAVPCVRFIDFWLMSRCLNSIDPFDPAGSSGEIDWRCSDLLYAWQFQLQHLEVVRHDDANFVFCPVLCQTAHALPVSQFLHPSSPPETQASAIRSLLAQDLRCRRTLQASEVARLNVETRHQSQPWERNVAPRAEVRNLWADQRDGQSQSPDRLVPSGHDLALSRQEFTGA